MQKVMKATALISAVLTALLSVLYHVTALGIFLSLAVASGTVFYHILMRLLVGCAFRRVKFDAQSHAFCVSDHEAALYEKWKVKSRKHRLPTYESALFDPRLHTWEEIASETCRAERVHETAAVLGFLPILAGIWFGAYPVFLITSVLAAAFDLQFAVLQRYNRRRILKLLSRRKKTVQP